MPAATIIISKKELEELIDKAVEKKLLELFGDPDGDFVLDEKLHAQLVHQKKAVSDGERGVDFEHVVRSLGLE